MADEYKCSVCNEVKPAGEFYWCRGELQNPCKACRKRSNWRRYHTTDQAHPCAWDGCTVEIDNARNHYCRDHQHDGRTDIKRKNATRAQHRHQPGYLVPCLCAGCKALTPNDLRYCARHQDLESVPVRGIRPPKVTVEVTPPPWAPKCIFRDDDRPRAFVLRAEQW